MNRTRWKALFAVLMLIIAACGGDDDAGEGLAATGIKG